MTDKIEDGGAALKPLYRESNGIRNSEGYVCFFRDVMRFDGQHERYEAELAEMERYANTLAAAPDMAEALERLLFEDSDISEEQRIKNRVLARAALARTRSNGGGA